MAAKRLRPGQQVTVKPAAAPAPPESVESVAMSWTRLALSNPTATLVAVLLVILFGAISMSRLPIQLTPEVERPNITIRTAWRAAAPEEIEAEIIEPQEKGAPRAVGVRRIVSKAQRGQGQVSIEFVVGHDLRRGLIEVLNRLNRVPRYPDDANEPVIDTVGENSRAIAWFMARTAEGNDRDIQSYKDYAEEVVQTRFERVTGWRARRSTGGANARSGSRSTRTGPRASASTSRPRPASPAATRTSPAAT